jgi:hypothetical protein
MEIYYSDQRNFAAISNQQPEQRDPLDTRNKQVHARSDAVRLCLLRFWACTTTLLSLHLSMIVNKHSVRLYVHRYVRKQGVVDVGLYHAGVWSVVSHRHGGIHVLFSSPDEQGQKTGRVRAPSTTWKGK